MWSTLTKNQELAQYISLFCLMLPETLMDEFVKSLRHPPPPSRWLRWLHQLLTPHCWQYGEVLGGKTYLDPPSPFLCTGCLIDLPWRFTIARNAAIALLNQTVYDVMNVWKTSRI